MASKPEQRPDSESESSLERWAAIIAALGARE